MRIVTLHSHSGEVDIVVDHIVSLRDSISSERPGATTISTADGKIHIVHETRNEVRELCALPEA